MEPRHFRFWPKGLPRSLPVPDTTLWYNLVVSAARYPHTPLTWFYGHRLTYAEAHSQAEALAGHLQEHCGLRAGDRVLLDLQNCPQFIIAYYGLLRAGAVVVPVNPMSVVSELEHYASDSGARLAIFGQDVAHHFAPLLGSILDTGIMATYSDYVDPAVAPCLPSGLGAAREPPPAGAVAWAQALVAGAVPGPELAKPNDLCAILYTSGTTGRPKGCMHSHRTVMTTAVGGAIWEGMRPGAVLLATAPFFHVTGMQHSMNAGIYVGGSLCPLLRWDAALAARLIQDHRCTHWANVPTMVVDLLAHPATAGCDLSSLQNVFGGGTAMPEAVARALFDRCGIEYMEAYGMTESMSQTHSNPPQRLRRQCGGIPVFDTQSIVVDPDSLRVLGPGEKGEILSRGPQIFLGYWGNPEATSEAFADVEGARYLRTGDLGHQDEDGFFHISDRLKRMINAAGFKVWPAEVESVMYQHHGIQEVAVIAAPDERRGETVKAVIVLRAEARATLGVEEIVAWCREHMAAYKVPRQVQFVDALPRSGSGKIQWRALQEKEWEALGGR